VRSVKGLSFCTTRVFPGMRRSSSPPITITNLSVVGSGPMCDPGYSFPFSRLLMKVVLPVEYCPIGHKQRIFSASSILLATIRSCSQSLRSCWSKPDDILRSCHPISHKERVLPYETNQPTNTWWSHMRYILSACHPIGHIGGIFSVPAILLVTYEVYSKCLPSYWSHMRYILSACLPICDIWDTFSLSYILSTCHPIGQKIVNPYVSPIPEYSKNFMQIFYTHFIRKDGFLLQTIDEILSQHGKV
jgi:hypothetical protein